MLADYTLLYMRLFLLIVMLGGGYYISNQADSSNQADNHPLFEKMIQLNHRSQWEEIARVPLQFNAYHTQGIVKAGDCFFMSAVEVHRWPKAFPDHTGGYPDRDEGQGIGHIFKFDGEGRLLADIIVGEGAVYHPGGLDSDGEYIWIPVTEYRPYSFSIIYRLHIQTLEVTEVLRIDDSIGAVAYNSDNNTLIGVNWDARDYYLWDLAEPHTSTPKKPQKTTRKSYYIAYQDCQYIGNQLMLCSGHQSYKTPQGTLRIGGWEIVDLRNDYRFVNLIPIPFWSPSGASITNNPCTIEATAHGIRAWFVPDDDEKAVLLIYEIKP